MNPHRRTGPPRVGIVGGGQLARMTYQAGIALAVQTRILAAQADDGAALVAHDVAIGGPAEESALRAFAAECDVLTFDHELVEVDQLRRLEADGRLVRPGSSTVALAQDKRRQREQFAAHGLPVPPFRPAAELCELVDFGVQHGWPIVAKARRGGYDGRGVWVLDGPAQVEQLWQRGAAGTLDLIVETWVPIERELAILVARRPNGQTAVYPLVETVQVDGICREVLAPARGAANLQARAAELALAIADLADLVGILAVELFETNGTLVINEIAARPHNSGHYSIEGCLTSQFENHLRAVLDWPLGATELVRPAVATVNVLGVEGQADLTETLPAALAVEGVRVHLYGKSARPGRKLGHVTALGDDLDDALARARRAAALLVEPVGPMAKPKLLSLWERRGEGRP